MPGCRGLEWREQNTREVEGEQDSHGSEGSRYPAGPSEESAVSRVWLGSGGRGSGPDSCSGVARERNVRFMSGELMSIVNLEERIRFLLCGRALEGNNAHDHTTSEEAHSDQQPDESMTLRCPSEQLGER